MSAFCASVNSGFIVAISKFVVSTAGAVTLGIVGGCVGGQGVQGMRMPAPFGLPINIMMTPHLVGPMSLRLPLPTGGAVNSVVPAG